MKFNEKIVKLRKMKGLTQDEFAAAVGVSRQAVYKWESGQSYPEVPKMLEIKLLFDVSIDDLLDEGYEVIVPEKQKRRRISRERRAEIEAAVSNEENTAFAAVETEPAAEPIVKTVALVTEKKEENETVTEAPVSQKETDTRKAGFFGRLFGRK